MDAGAQQAFGDIHRDAEPGRRVFAISDHKIDLPVGDDRRQLVLDDAPSGLADDVADEKYLHIELRDVP